jgi:hypothetical protein
MHFGQVGQVGKKYHVGGFFFIDVSNGNIHDFLYWVHIQLN